MLDIRGPQCSRGRLTDYLDVYRTFVQLLPDHVEDLRLVQHIHQSINLREDQKPELLDLVLGMFISK